MWIEQPRYGSDNNGTNYYPAINDFANHNDHQSWGNINCPSLVPRWRARPHRRRAALSRSSANGDSSRSCCRCDECSLCRTHRCRKSRRSSVDPLRGHRIFAASYRKQRRLRPARGWMFQRRIDDDHCGRNHAHTKAVRISRLCEDLCTRRHYGDPDRFERFHSVLPGAMIHKQGSTQTGRR